MTTETEVQELIELANEIEMPMTSIATHLGISASYLYKLRTGRMPVTDGLLAEIRKLKKKLKAFRAA